MHCGKPTTPSIRRMLAMALVSGSLVVLPARAAAADLSEVGLGTDTLMTGILFEHEAGIYQQESQVADGRLSARLTFHLPAAPTTAQPGPVVVFWQLRIDVADAMYGDGSQRLVGPPMVEAVLPDCDAAGACELQVEVGGSITPALEATDLDWVSESGARLYVAVTLARTYADGTLLQAVRPQLGSGGGGGTLAQPLTTNGGLSLSSLIPADAAAAHHAEIPTEEFGIGGPPYDWGDAVAGALGISTASESPSASATSPSSPAPSPSPAQDPTTTPSAAVAGLLVALVFAMALLLVRVRQRPRSDSAGSGRELLTEASLSVQ